MRRLRRRDLLPYDALIAVSLSKSWGLAFWKNLTLANYHFVLFEYDMTRRAIVNSLMLAVASATIAALLGAMIGWIDLRTKIPGRRLLDYISLIPLGLPGIVMAVALIQFWLRMPVPLYGTLGILLLAYTARYIPLGVRSANTALRQVDPSLEESARILGASWGTTMREITLPLIRPGLFAGWILVFVPAIQELSASILLFSSESMTLAVAVYNLYETGYIEPVPPSPSSTWSIIGGGDLARQPAERHEARHEAHGVDGRWSGIRIENLAKHYGTKAELAAVSRSQSRHQGQPVRNPARPFRLRQDDDLAADRRLHDTRCRHDPRRRPARLVAGQVVPPEERGMGMVFQNYAVWPHKTVFENVAFGLSCAAWPPTKRASASTKVLELVNLTGFETRYPNELSRRAAAARGAGALPGGRAAKSCCSTSRSPISTPSCASACAGSSSAAAPHRHHLRLCHARSGRSARPVRPDRRDARGPAAAVRQPARSLLTPRQPRRRRLHGAGEPALGQGHGSRYGRRRAAHLRLSLPRDLRVGDSVDVAIRPEDIRLGGDGVPARVEEQSYLGNLSEYHVALADGTRLRVQTPAMAYYAVGIEVALAVDTAQCNVFRTERGNP